jgi:hypothetical protein
VLVVPGALSREEIKALALPLSANLIAPAEKPT